MQPYNRASEFQKRHGDSDFSSGELFAWYSVPQRPHLCLEPEGKFWFLGFLDGRKMHFPALFHGYISVPKHPIFCTMYHKVSIHLPPQKIQLFCQFNCQSKFLSHVTALSLTPGSNTAFFFEWSLRWSWVVLQKLRKENRFIVLEWW